MRVPPLHKRLRMRQVISPRGRRAFGPVQACFLLMVVALCSLLVTRAIEPTSAERQLVQLCPSLKNFASVRADVLRAVHQAASVTMIDPHLLMSVIATESSCRHRARSPKGALGLMQLMPATARYLGVADPMSIEDNVHGGARYLAELSKRFGGDLELALAAYNAGPSRVRKYGGVPPYKETRDFVDRVMRRLETLKSQKARGV